MNDNLNVTNRILTGDSPRISDNSAVAEMAVGAKADMGKADTDNVDMDNVDTVKVFVWPVRVYYEDTDAGGVVYHANYLRFMERARSEWLRDLGHPVDQIVAQEKRLFVVRSVEMKFIRPAFLGDDLRVSAEIIETRKASMRLAQQVSSVVEGELQLRVKAIIELAMVSSETFRPVALPDFLKT